MKIKHGKWNLAPPNRPLVCGTASRAEKHGPLVIIPEADYQKLAGLAKAKAVQIKLPYDVVD